MRTKTGGPSRGRVNIRQELVLLSRPIKIGFDLNRYLGTPRKVLCVPAVEKRKLVRRWIAKNKEESNFLIKKNIGEMLKAGSFEERTVPGVIMQYNKAFRASVIPSDMEKWLSHMEGWAEIDSLCQSSFDAETMLNVWKKWFNGLRKLNKSKNISKRRASLVLLVRPVRESADKRLSDLAFQNILALRHEKHVLITKAISWLLRALIEKHKAEVRTFIKEHKNTLPAIAVRETTKKLLTGKK